RGTGPRSPQWAERRTVPVDDLAARKAHPGWSVLPVGASERAVHRVAEQSPHFARVHSLAQGNGRGGPYFALVSCNSINEFRKRGIGTREPPCRDRRHHHHAAYDEL